jgi:hypothetical protein
VITRFSHLAANLEGMTKIDRYVNWYWPLWKLGVFFFCHNHRKIFGTCFDIQNKCIISNSFCDPSSKILLNIPRYLYYLLQNSSKLTFRWLKNKPFKIFSLNNWQFLLVHSVLITIISCCREKSGQKEPRNIVKSLANSLVSDNLDCEETHTSWNDFFHEWMTWSLSKFG